MPPPTDPKLVEKVRRLSARKTPAEIAEETGLSSATVYRLLANLPRSGPAAPTKTAGGRAKPSKGQPPARPRAPTDEDEDDAEPGDLAAAPDDIAALDRLIAMTERRLRKASDARAGALTSTLAALVIKRAKLRPPVPPTADELERQARPLADEVLEQIETCVRAAEAELGLP